MDIANSHIMALLPYKKCVHCNQKKAIGVIFTGGQSSPHETLVPKIVEDFTVPVCSDCQQDVMNSKLDSYDVIDSDHLFKKCQGCGKMELKMKCCERCKSVFYCSRECQRGHWKLKHKKYCKPYENKK